MATIPTFSPHLPFLGLIPGGLSPGRTVRISGIIHNYGERCEIHFQSGASVYHRNDVALQVGIRPSEHAIVRNTLQNHVPGHEERYGGCPVQYGQTFDLLVAADASQFRIVVNGAHFCTFAHRLPLYSAQYISVSGGCVIHSITTEPGVPGSVPTYPQPPIGQYPTYVPPTGVFVPNVPTYPNDPGVGFPPPHHPEYQPPARPF